MVYCGHYWGLVPMLQVVEAPAQKWAAAQLLLLPVLGVKN